MKIAVAAIEKEENSEISSRAGRAPYFLIFDEKLEGRIKLDTNETIGNDKEAPKY